MDLVTCETRTASKKGSSSRLSEAFPAFRIICNHERREVYGRILLWRGCRRCWGTPRLPYHLCDKAGVRLAEVEQGFPLILFFTLLKPIRFRRICSWQLWIRFFVHTVILYLCLWHTPKLGVII